MFSRLKISALVLIGRLTVTFYGFDSCPCRTDAGPGAGAGQNSRNPAHAGR